MSASDTIPLFRPSEHEPLAGAAWDERQVRLAIEEIVADAESAYDPERLWPLHERDDDPPNGPLTLYEGAAGVIWALHGLGSRGWEATSLELLRRYREQPDFGSVAPSYWAGESGIGLVAYRLTGDGAVAERLHELVLANAGHESNEVMWGAPGTMLVAQAMHQWTGEPRWDDAWEASAARVRDAWGADGLWTQLLGGRERQFLGPAHGFAGNVRVLANRGEVALARVDAALERTAIRSGDEANWSPLAGPPDGDQIRVQWCHGAPGIVASVGELADEGLMLAGGELTWRAGPLAKGPGLCHGTAGNGYAFLRLYRRTGDVRWLERARAFAMHAIAQSERQRDAAGRRRYTLFNGDLGVALYLRDCLTGRDLFPTLDGFLQ